MNWLPRDKRNPFIAVVVSIAAILALIFFGLIRAQYASLSNVAEDRKTAGSKLSGIISTIKNGTTTDAELAIFIPGLTAPFVFSNNNIRWKFRKSAIPRSEVWICSRPSPTNNSVSLSMARPIIMTWENL
jgi:hypothetical protein